MSSNTFTKDNLDTYLKELAKEFRKINGKHMPAEIILVGGAAILANYGFREMTTDIDAIIGASSSMKDAINRVGDKFNLPSGWLNTDFISTSSYSKKLAEFSVYYKTYSNILIIRTISAEYLIAMKLRSGRKYKNDLSDIIGILAEHEECRNPITLESINTAFANLYGNLAEMSKDSKVFIENSFAHGNFRETYNAIRNEEIISKDILLAFEQDYPNVTNQANIDDILSALKSKSK